MGGFSFGVEIGAEFESSGCHDFGFQVFCKKLVRLFGIRELVVLLSRKENTSIVNDGSSSRRFKTDM